MASGHTVDTYGSYYSAHTNTEMQQIKIIVDSRVLTPSGRRRTSSTTLPTVVVILPNSTSVTRVPLHGRSYEYLIYGRFTKPFGPIEETLFISCISVHTSTDDIINHHMSRIIVIILLNW